MAPFNVVWQLFLKVYRYMTGMMDSFFIFFLPRNLLTSYQISVAQGENSEINTEHLLEMSAGEHM